MRALGLDPAQQAALFRARGQLTWRQFTRERGRIVGAFFAAVFLIPLTVGAAVGTGFAYLRAPDPWPAQLLSVVLVALWGIWMVVPIFAFRLNEGLDLERLQVYPISRRDLIASLLIGTVFDYPTYFTLPLFVAILIGWGLGPALPIVALAVLLSYAQMILTSRLVVTAAGGILRSRRFRDVSVIVISLVGSSCYFIQRGFAEVGRQYVTPEQLASLRPLNVLQWLPPGAAARAIERAAAGAWVPSLLWLLYAGVLLVGITWLWWKLMVRFTTGGGFLLDLRGGDAERPKRRRRQLRTLPLLGRLPADVRQLAAKEFKSAWRIPQRRVGMIQGVLLPLFFAGIALFSGGGVPDELPEWVGLGLPLYALFVFWTTSQNMLGWEGSGLPTLLLTPVPRGRIFLGKGLALSTIAGVALLPIGIGVLVLAPGWPSVAGLLASVAVAGASIAVGAVSSVLFAYPIDLDETTGRLSTGGNFKTGLANLVLVPSATTMLAAPPVVVTGLAYWLDLPWLGYLGGIAGLLYGIALFVAGTGLAGRLLVPREAEIVQATRLEQS